MQAKFAEITFTDADVVNPDQAVYQGENNYGVRPWLLHDAGFVLAVVFADCLQDAIDEAVDADRLDRFMVSAEDMGDYPNEEGLSFLGNASEPFDIESLGYIELPIPARSFVAQLNASVNA